MTMTQTIELNDSERLTLQNALGIIENIAAIADTSIDNVFEYLCEVAKVEDNHEYSLKALHNINEIK